MTDASTNPGNSSISQVINIPVMHISQCDTTTYCRLDMPDMTNVSRNFTEATCPACFVQRVLDMHRFIDDEVRRPIREFLISVGDDREFASEAEIEAMAKIVLAHKDEWRRLGERLKA